jgi:glycosyltransferase involved in cell wall biosynthesis
MAASPPEGAVVCVLGAPTPAAAQALAAHTAADAPVLVVGGHDTELPGRPPARGVESLRAALEAATGSDVAFLATAAVVTDGWLHRLAEASHSDSTVGSSTALELRDPAAASRVAARLRADAAGTPARIAPRPSLCAYVRAEALAGVGPPDGSLAPPAAVVDLLDRMLAMGFQHVLAGTAAVAGPPVALDQSDLAALTERFPWIAEPDDAPEPLFTPALARPLAAARRAEHGLDVTLDIRLLGSELSGAQIHVLETVGALARSGSVRLRLVVSDDRLGGEPQRLLERLDMVELLPETVLLGGTETPRTAVVHRPVQVAVAQDVELLRDLGGRIVVTQQDLIAYRNPSYHADPDLWLHYRRATRLALAMCDAAVVLSRHTLDDLLADDLIEPGRAKVLPISAEPAIALPTAEPRPPEGMPDLERFIVCLGNDFLHKNRTFAIRLLGALRERGWPGGLVLVGARMEYGSSFDDEEALLQARPELEGVVARLGPVDEARKAWLYGQAAAVVYPTTYEGFGLVPFEAGRAGVPCLFAPQAALGEVLPREAAVLVPWDEQASAERALPLLAASPERTRHVELLRRAADGLPSWDDHATALLDVYERVALAPERESRVIAAQALEREAELARWYDLRDELGEDAFSLVTEGRFPPDVQRALLSVVTRPRLRRAMFTALRGLYRAGYRVRRR